MSDFLATMAENSRRRVAAARREVPAASLEEAAAGRGPAPALRLGEFELIAEIKRSSPAEGELADAQEDIVARAHRYVQGGAVALSVLTEPGRFAGSLEDLQTVAGGIPGVPVMRKDFIVDDYQLLEARAAGAAGALLIVSLLDDENLQRMVAIAGDLDLFVLLEAFDDEDASRMCALADTEAGSRMIDDERLLFGVNSRDLRTLEVDISSFGRLRPKLPENGIAVAESGVTEPEHAAEVASLGYDLVLVGTALMRAPDPRPLLAGLRDAGRAARRKRSRRA